jgi:glycosyltransferase involved in cell wall biosynthesis
MKSYQHIFVSLEPTADRISESHGRSFNVQVLDWAHLRTTVSTAKASIFYVWPEPGLLKAIFPIVEVSRRAYLWVHQGNLPETFRLLLDDVLRNSSSLIVVHSSFREYEKQLERVSELHNKERVAFIPSFSQVQNIKFQTHELRKDSPVLWMGTLHRGKLHDDFFCFAKAAVGDDRELWIAGSVTEPDWVATSICSQNLVGRVVFLGFITNLTQVFSRCDVYLHILKDHHYGTSENALREAMFAGLVPIVRDQPPENELIRDGANGLIVTNANQVSDRLTSLVDRPGRFKSMSKGAHSTILSQQQNVQKGTPWLKLFKSQI